MKRFSFNSSVSANPVLVPVKVTDDRGDFVPGFKQEDFRVIENGQLQRTEGFELGDTPVTVGLIVEHSRSMELRRAASSIVWIRRKSFHPPAFAFWTLRLVTI
jgi:hypothetical protein